MIVRLTGLLAEVLEQTVIVDVAGVGYEIYVPAVDLPMLREKCGERVTLLTLQQFEGNAAVGALTPRLYGFLRAVDRAFLLALTEVKGISMRRALRAMAAPTATIAAAIARGDERFLATLPEIGKKTAGLVTSALRDTAVKFLDAREAAPETAPAALSEAARLAINILIQWGDRPADAQQWVSDGMRAEPELARTEDIVRAAYRAKNRAARAST